MTAFAYYLLKVIACSGILFLYYHFFLRNRLFHQWNRFYLLASVVLSLCLPLIQLDVAVPTQAAGNALNYLFFVQSADHYLEEYVVYYERGISATDWLMIGYAAITASLLISLLVSVYKIVRLVRSHVANVYDHFILLPTREPGSPFSFLHYIFWNEDIPLNTPAGQQIFHHELVHVNEKHTWDKLFMQLLIVFFWCNPFFWLIRKELRFVHEFIADQKAVGSDTEAFANMILQSIYHKQADAICNPFFQSSIKRRLKMLTQLKNPRVAYFSRLAVLPLMATVVLAFTVKTDDTQKNAALSMPVVISTNDTLPKKNSEIHSIDVRKNKETGINEIEIYYTNGRREVLTEKEANEKGLIHNGGYGNQKNIAGTNFQQKGLVLRDAAQNPLFILDGKEVSKEEIERLNPNRIERVDVLKDASAIAIYGEKGRHGVVEIKTRNQTSGEPMSLRTNGQEVLRGNITNLEFMDSNKVYFEAQDIVVNNKKSNAADTVPQKEVIVRGYKKTPATKEVTVQGRRLDSEIVFEKAEFAPSIDRDEWRKFLEKYTMQIITEIGQKAAPGRYTVYVRFIVEKDGSVTNVSTLNDPGYGLNRKVLEIMKHAPKWKPAIQNERVVRSYHTQPITFVIDEVET